MPELNKNVRTKTTYASVVPFEEKGATEIHVGVPERLVGISTAAA